MGAGHFAAIQLEAWREVPGVQFVGLYNRTPAKAQELAARFGIGRVSGDLRELLESTRPDFVDICTAVETHLEFVRIAADLGIPILCQKPVAPSWEESVELVDYCRARGVPLMINENWRWQCW